MSGKLDPQVFTSGKFPAKKLGVEDAEANSQLVERRRNVLTETWAHYGVTKQLTPKVVLTFKQKSRFSIRSIE